MEEIHHFQQIRIRVIKMPKVKFYTELQKKLHSNIQDLITSRPFINMDADEVLVVFGRVYSVYALECLREQGVIKFTNTQNQNKENK